jgi:hypothetical protein
VFASTCEYKKLYKKDFNTIPNLINVLEVIFNDYVCGELSDNLKRDVSTLLTYYK